MYVDHLFPRSDCADSRHRLFDTEQDSDSTVEYSKRVWSLHRIILEAGSVYIKKACSQEFEARLLFQSSKISLIMPRKDSPEALTSRMMIPRLWRSCYVPCTPMTTL